MKKMTKAMLMTALILGSVQWGGTPVHANELDTFTLDEYVVTATRTPVKVFDANANISVVTRDEIENAHYEGLDDALRNVPGVQILDYGQSGFVSNTLRINGASNVVVLIDGVRVNQSGQAFQPQYQNLDNVERIEILKGAASALYGSDAKGGVINIITSVPDGNKTKVTVAGGNFGAEQYKLHNEGKEGTWSYSIDIGKDRKGDFEDGSGENWEQKYDSENVNLKVRKEFSEGSNLTVGYDYHQYDWRYENNTANDWGNRIMDGDGEENAAYAIWNQKIDETLSNTFSIRNTEFKYNSLTGNPWSIDYETLSISDYLTKQYGDTHVVTLGFDYVRDNNKENSSGVLEYGKIFQRSVYLQDEWNFDKKWKLTSGVRYDDHSWAGESTTPRFNLGYKFNDKTNMYVSYSEFFVAPWLSDMLPGYKNEGNLNLEPEEGENYEIGINHKFDDTFTMTAHAYKRKTDNRIRYVAFDANNGRNENVGEEDAEGFDIQFSKAVNNNLTIFTGYTYNHFEDPLTGDNHYGLFPRHTVNVGVDYSNKKFNAVLNTRFALEYAKGEKAYSGMFPDNNFYIVDVAANYKPSKNIKLFAKVNNLFDKYYSENTDATWCNYLNGSDIWYPMPGRSFIVGMEYSF